MKRFFTLYLVSILLATVLACSGDDPVNPEEAFQTLSPSHYQMVVGPRKYMILLNNDAAFNEWSNFVCSLEPAPELGHPSVIESNADDYGDEDLLIPSGLARNVIHGLEPSSRYYCRTYTRVASGVSYGPTYVFNTGPVMDKRLVYTTTLEQADGFSYQQVFFYDSLGRLSIRLNHARGPFDQRFGSLSYAYVSVFEHEPNRVYQYTGELRSGSGWSLEWPMGYSSRRVYNYENNELISHRSLSSNLGTTYYREGDRVIVVKADRTSPDSVVNDYFLDEGYRIARRYVLDNGSYRYNSTTRYEYDLSKRDPYYDMLNRQRGYGNFPLVVSYELTNSNDQVTTRQYDYVFDGPFPSTNQDKRYFYTEFD